MPGCQNPSAEMASRGIGRDTTPSELGYAVIPEAHIDWHPTRRLLATQWGVVADEPAPTLSEWLAESGTMRFPGGCDWTADGEYLLVSRPVTDDPDAPHPTQIITVAVGDGTIVSTVPETKYGAAFGPFAAPFGHDFACFASAGRVASEPLDLCLADATRSDPRVLTHEVYSAIARWSPSGELLLTAKRIADEVVPAIVRASDGETRVLSDLNDLGLQHVSAQAWLPDDHLLCIGPPPIQQNGVANSVYEVDWEERRVVRTLMRAPGWWLFEATFSPGGDHLAFFREKLGGDALQLVIYDLVEDVLLIAVDARLDDVTKLYGPPAWSPDGSEIAFWRQPRETRYPLLCVVNSDGSGHEVVWPNDDQDPLAGH